MERALFSRWFARRLAYLAVATMLFGCILSVVLARAAVSNDSHPAWATPSAMTLKRVGSASITQNAPTLFSNLDCTPVTYRLVASSTMKTGCFTETAFGLLDSDDYTVIFNGTDEGLPLIPYTAHQILAPWPKAMDLVALSPVSTGGAQIGLYKNPLAALQDQRNLTAKQLVGPPDITLKDTSGKPLVVNPQTLAFSDGGSWLVVETLSGSFVRVNLATLGVTAFAPAYGSQGSPALLQSRVAVGEDGRFIAISNDFADEFKVYDLATCDGTIQNTGHDLPPMNCKWHDYRPFAKQQIIGLRSIRRLRFVNEGLLSFEASSTDPAASGGYELAPTASIDFLTDYIGLGDSYTSGEGAFDYLDGTDTPDDTCHLSRHSYPLLLAQDLFGANGGHSVACSGAVINDVASTSDSYHGQVKGAPDLKDFKASQPLGLDVIETNFMPGYVAQQRFVKRWQPATTTVSIGGNDIGFGDILRNCVEPHISRHVSANTCYNTYEDRLELASLIDRTVPRWTALYAQLKREAPGTKFYAIGYPQITVDNGNCALNVQLNKNELKLAGEIIDYLDQAISKAAGAAGVTYVDISQALKGHRLCEAAGYDVAVNGITAGGDTGLFGVGILGRESYHPNALGHELMEQAVLEQTHNLDRSDLGGGNADQSPEAESASAPLLDAPKTGRTVYTLVPDDSLTQGIGTRGLSFNVRASGASDGLKPATVYEVHFDGPDSNTIGTLTSDDYGDIDGAVVTPADAIPGGHTIDITGKNESGEPVDVTQPLYVPAGDADIDGDGIDDITDSCRGIINSGRDNDRDGVDDICDSGTSSQRSGSGDSGGSTGRLNNPSRSVLGATSVNSNGRGKPDRKQAPGNDSTVPGKPIGGINYWCWIILAIVLWLFMKLRRKYTQTAGFRLQ